MIAPARAAAFDILINVARNQGHSDELLRGSAVDRLSPQDRNLTTNLVMGTLRWQLLLDQRITALLARPETKLPLPVQMALRLGAFQLIFLDRIPAHAAIGESVELAKQGESKFAAGMVNAILRKIASSAKLTQSVPQIDAVAAHPEWLVARWAENYGSEAAKAICLYDQQQPPVTLRLVDEQSEASLLSNGIELAPGDFLASARRVVRGDVTASAAFRSGAVRIQDEGSQLIAELADHGQRILDLCAAPGGKTAILAERNPEAVITACDVSSRRLNSMRELLAGSPGAERIRYLHADATTFQLEPEYDLILCDAPCSGTGTIARNPEIRHRLAPADLKRQQAKQLAILSSAMQGLAPGGRLIYSTCSLEPEENEEVVERCVDRAPGMALQSFARVEGLPATAFSGHYLRTIPGIHPCDGFFAAQIISTRTA